MGLPLILLAGAAVVALSGDDAPATELEFQALAMKWNPAPAPPRSPAPGPTTLSDLPGYPTRILQPGEQWTVEHRVARLGAPATFNLIAWTGRSVPGTMNVANGCRTIRLVSWDGTTLTDALRGGECTGNWRAPYRGQAMHVTVERRGDGVWAKLRMTEQLKRTQWHATLRATPA